MPGHLHGARRIEVRFPGLRAAALALAATIAGGAGCSRRTSATTVDAAQPTGSAAPSGFVAPDGGGRQARPRTPSTLLLDRFGTDGLDAADRLSAACGDRASYLALRHAAVASLSLWRAWIRMAGEASFGPEIAIQESGGSMGALDRAIETGDCAGQRDAARNIGGAFRVSLDVLGRGDVPPRVMSKALSDAAYRLGEAILESTPFVPEGDDAAAADVAGLLDFVEGGVRALDLSAAPLAPFDRLHGVTRLADVTDRAALVRATGLAGQAIRDAMRERGIATTLYTRPLHDATAQSALTLPRPAAPADPAQAALGRRLFFEPRLSPDRSRSCASCHVPERAFADGRVAPASRDAAVPLRRNTPSLLYAPVEAVLTWDGRVRTADAQARMVIHTKAEMGLADDDVTAIMSKDATYARAFQTAFDRAPTPADVGLALSAFEASALVPGTARIDRFARGELPSLGAEESAGLDVFAGKGRCARCHVPPVFGGSRPPDFTAPVYAVLGVPESPGATVVDSDRGRDGAFRVPTVRNAGRTAPYFHHGRYPTLDAVVDFYDRGGGRGLGLDVPQQDPEIRPLHLTAGERRALMAFMREALDDSR